METVRIIRDNLRKTDFLGRYGGEEFLIVMPDTTLDEGYQMAERIRIRIKDTLFYHDMVDLTISGGIAEWDHNSIRDLIETADRLLCWRLTTRLELKRYKPSWTVSKPSWRDFSHKSKRSSISAIWW